MEVLKQSDDDITVFISQDDICDECSNRYGCPLIECLGNGLVTAAEPIDVLDCAHFIPFNNKRL